MTITQSLFDNFLNGESSVLTAFNGSSTIPLYNGAVQNINISAVFPANEVNIINSAYSNVRRPRVSGTPASTVGFLFPVILYELLLYCPVAAFHARAFLLCVAQNNVTEMIELLNKTHHLEVPARLYVTNPFNVNITVYGFQGNVYYNDSKTGDVMVGYLHIDPPFGPNITIPGNTTSLSPEVAIVVDTPTLEVGHACCASARHLTGCSCVAACGFLLRLLWSGGRCPHVWRGRTGKYGLLMVWMRRGLRLTGVRRPGRRVPD